MTQLWLSIEELGKQVISNNGNGEQSFKDKTDPTKAVSCKAITRKEVTKMIAKVQADGALKNGHAPKYLP